MKYITIIYLPAYCNKKGPASNLQDLHLPTFAYYLQKLYANIISYFMIIILLYHNLIVNKKTKGGPNDFYRMHSH